MRRLTLVAFPLLLVMLACTANTASAQVQPGPTTGGVVITLTPDNGAPAPAGLTGTLSRNDALAVRRWLVGSAAPVQAAASRPSFKARRATLRRNPV